jgi:hypothetical protein
MMRKLHLEEMEMCGATQSGLAPMTYRLGPHNVFSPPN